MGKLKRMIWVNSSVSTKGPTRRRWPSRAARSPWMMVVTGSWTWRTREGGGQDKGKQPEGSGQNLAGDVRRKVHELEAKVAASAKAKAEVRKTGRERSA
ncbi:hypothetical protein GGTG_01097 [Gaeumannomyces tritici R3-111a-1]|uniref:Uncharacterized protein n=1 Tax=Gaeumannomyces tritici (strain R3-111a-1) TaxID=644352 RepID=J3NIL9_GAET3|nr:hypothetical protein GGTG_01097 [Gaeumannomyces tritici R3-111a-1]EJT81112.1 hypothetical protein GGTG_01097 [Gaeumannomyces tritici R3-111a-1]